MSQAYDLEERTAKFGEQIILVCRSLPNDFIGRSIIGQLVRSGTSIGANYMEANGASSPMDFRNKIYLSKKECQETRHWIRMAQTCFPDYKDSFVALSHECYELNLIFQKITSTLDRNRKLKI